MSDEFATGKVVTLASGGGPMTVDWQGEEPTGELVPCVWFDAEQRYFERKFSKTALIPYRSQYDIMMGAADKVLAERGSGPLPRYVPRG